MLYKLVFLALLFIMNVKNIGADNTRQLLQTTATPDTTGDDGETNVTDDGTDDGNDDDLDVETTEDGSFDNETTEDGSIDGESATESPSGSTSSSNDDSNDDSNSDSNSNSGSTSDGSVSDDDSNVDNSEDDDASEEDICGGLAESDCTTMADDDGDAECAFNAVKNDCYSIERRDGRHGSGNFDDGFNAAKQQSASESSQLNTLIGVLGGIIGALVLIISGGAYYFYKEKSKIDWKTSIGQTSTIDEYNDEQEMVINTVEDVSPVMTKGNAVSDPMLS